MTATPTPPLLIVQAIASVENMSAGTTYCVTRLSEALAEAGHHVELLTTGPAGDWREGNLRTKSCAIGFARAPIAGRLRFSPEYRAELIAAAAAGALIHSNGLWLMPNIYPSSVALRCRRPLVVSPHGMLAKAALAFSPMRKRVFSALVQRSALEAVKCFHATSLMEHDDIRAYGLNAPIAVVPNGIDLPAAATTTPRETGPRTVLYLGRLHPIKGLDRLLAAWARLEARHPAWRLRIVGPSHHDHRFELEALAVSLKLCRATFEDGVYGAEKQAALHAADLLVLPSQNENFAMVVAEALASGRPVISTKGAPWSGLVEHGCGWWIDHGVEPLATALGEAMAMPRASLDAMGENGRAWMARDFSWERIAAGMAEVYRWCLGHGDRPASVHCA